MKTSHPLLWVTRSRSTPDAGCWQRQRPTYQCYKELHCQCCSDSGSASAHARRSCCGGCLPDVPDDRAGCPALCPKRQLSLPTACARAPSQMDTGRKWLRNQRPGAPAGGDPAAAQRSQLSQEKTSSGSGPLCVQAALCEPQLCRLVQFFLAALFLSHHCTSKYVKSCSKNPSFLPHASSSTVQSLSSPQRVQGLEHPSSEQA